MSETTQVVGEGDKNFLPLYGAQVAAGWELSIGHDDLWSLQLLFRTVLVARVLIWTMTWKGKG